MNSNTKERLEYLRGEMRNGTLSYGELAELQSLAKHIEPGDVELLEAAGVPECMLSAMNTVNVIEMTDMTIQKLVAFPDDKEGNAKAEELFTQLINENKGDKGDKDVSDDDIAEAIAEGYWQDQLAWVGHGYRVCLVHSSKN